jgi:hypothetical protein
MHGWIVLVAQPRFSIASISEMLGDRFLATGHQHRPRAITALRLHLRQGGIRPRSDKIGNIRDLDVGGGDQLAG